MPLDLEQRAFIGRGGQGAVLLCYDRHQRRFLALKIVRLRGGEAEARLVLDSQLRRSGGEPDPWLNPWEDLGGSFDVPPGVLRAVPPELRTGTWLWFAMRYVHGPNAAELSAGDPDFGFSEAAALGAQIAQRLARRRAGELHLDLKPENVLCDLDGRAFLVDGWLDTKAGTAPYAAPEQRGDGAKAGAEADLFALGRILRCLIARNFPGAGSPPDLVPPLPEIPADAPPEKRRLCDALVALVQKLCDPSPSARGDAGAAARDLLEIAAGLGGVDVVATLKASIARATLPERLSRLGEELGKEGAAREAPREKPQPSHERLWRVLGFATAALLVFALALAYWSTRPEKSWRESWKPSPPPESRSARDGSEEFCDDLHRSAEVTLLGPGACADARHAGLKVIARDRVRSAAFLRSDESILWKQDDPQGIYRFDVRPGTYHWQVARDNPYDPSGRPSLDTREFEIGPHSFRSFDTHDRIESAPHSPYAARQSKARDGGVAAPLR